jgi:hypothetical protein
MVLKYIITNGGAILFPEEIVHSQVAEGFKKENHPIYSAGFVALDVNMNIQKCYGESTSLEIKSHPTQDMIVIKECFSNINSIKYGLLIVKDLYKSIKS